MILWNSTYMYTSAKNLPNASPLKNPFNRPSLNFKRTLCLFHPTQKHWSFTFLAVHTPRGTRKTNLSCWKDGWVRYVFVLFLLSISIMSTFWIQQFIWRSWTSRILYKDSRVKNELFTAIVNSKWGDHSLGTNSTQLIWRAYSSDASAIISFH